MINYLKATRLKSEVINIPLPEPADGQDKNSFISACMSNETMKREYPDQKQRVAVCYSQWKRKHKSDDEIAKCVKCGLKDMNGYFCRYKDGEKFYYDINDAGSKQLAKSKAEEFGINLLSETVWKQDESPNPSGNKDEDDEDDDEDDLNYSVPKSKDEIAQGTIISYKGKIGKVVKVINT